MFNHEGAEDYTAGYRTLLGNILGRGVVQKNERTGARVRVLPGSASLQIRFDERLLPMPGVRRLRPRTAAAEVAWFISGSRDARDLERLGCKIWSKFVDRYHEAEDFAEVRGAYGYRWRHAFGCDQLGMAVEALRSDPSDRQVVVTAWDPREDGLGRRNSKNVPCPTQFTLSSLSCELHSTVLVRSSDVFVGLPYDVMGHALLMAAIAESTGLALGSMTFVLAHAHLYETHWNMAREAAFTTTWAPDMRLPRWTVDSIAFNPEMYVEEVGRLQDAAEWPEFDPKPELVL